MNKQDKELLLKDLCARLPYGVKMNVIRSNVTEVAININPFNEEIWLNDAGAYVDIDEIKPYLRPMSSMTGEEMFEIEMMNNHSIQHIDTVGVRFKAFYDTAYNEMYDLFDWLNKHHFDYRGLIQMGLAIEAPEGMYNF